MNRLDSRQFPQPLVGWSRSRKFSYGTLPKKDVKSRALRRNESGSCRQSRGPERARSDCRKSRYESTTVVRWNSQELACLPGWARQSFRLTHVKFLELFSDDTAFDHARTSGVVFGTPLTCPDQPTVIGRGDDHRCEHNRTSKCNTTRCGLAHI